MPTILGLFIVGLATYIHLWPLLPAVAVLTVYFIYQDSKEPKLSSKSDEDRLSRQLEAYRELFGDDPTPDISTNLTSVSQPKLPYGMYISAEDKSEYLASKYWKDLKAKCHKRDSHKCVTCGDSNYLNCHHITYCNLGKDTLDDVTTLCESCHSSLHLELGYDRATTYIPHE